MSAADLGQGPLSLRVCLLSIVKLGPVCVQLLGEAPGADLKARAL